jgi:hypothetical protein
MKIKTDLIEAEAKLVEYHSSEWYSLTSNGWVTHIVEKISSPTIGVDMKVAVMVYIG